MGERVFVGGEREPGDFKRGEAVGQWRWKRRVWKKGEEKKRKRKIKLIFN